MPPNEASPGSIEQHNNTIVQLFKLLQTDYRLARKELEAVSYRFGQREAATEMQLSATLDTLGEMNGSSRRNGIDHAATVGTGHRGCRGSTVSKSNAHSPSPTLEVYCLGKFELHVGWNKVENWYNSKAKNLLKYIICQRRKPVSKDVLLELLWPDCEPHQANNSLRVTVHSLRKTLSAARDEKDEFTWIIFEDGMYMINPGVELWIDFEQFEYHWRTARRLEQEGKLTEAIAEHEAADTLYKGDFLQENLYDDWTLLKRESLKNTYLTILTKLADYALQRSDYEACVIYCQNILSSECCREDAYQRLIQCYSRLGRRMEALKWYRLCEKIMKAELNIPTSPETVLLYRKLSNGEHI